MSFGGRKIFLHYLAEPATGNTYYVDGGGRVQLGAYIPLQDDPEGWLENRVTFGRSASYYGLNRTFTVPLKFVGDGAKIIRYLVYKKRGIEQPLQLIILKWNPDTDVYELYYKGMVSLPNKENLVAEGVNVNVMEGGVVQLLKAYENTVFQIPCDGSIPENIRVKLDGLLFKDTFHYQGVSIAGINSSAVLPAVFTGNEGDNIGIIHGDPQYETVPNISYYTTSLNYIFSSVGNISVLVEGKIKVRKTSPGASSFSLAAITSSPIQIHLASSGLLPVGDSEFSFLQSVGLGANENLFIAFDSVLGSFDILEWSFDLKFDSRYRTTVAWAVRAYDLFKLIVQNINQRASSTLQQFNYQAVSNYLQQYSNLVCISGDALRASSDANYPGPVVIKTSLKDFFDSFDAILNGSLGNQQVPGQVEALFFEEKGYVFNSSSVTMELGEVSDFKIGIALDYYFTTLKIGCPNQQYEEKAGKYEYNTTALWSAPIKSIPAKERSLVTKYRTDPHGVEYTRFSSGGRSTTHNASDNSVFILNVDNSVTEYDRFTAQATGVLNLAASNTNTPISLSNASTDYFTPNQNFTVFTFTKDINTPQFTVQLTAFGAVTGPGNLTLSVWKNGVQIFTIAGSGLISASNQLSGLIFNQGDTVEVKYTTPVSTTASITFLSLDIISEQIVIYTLKRVSYDSITGLPNPTTYFNIEDLTPKRMLIRQGNFLRSPLYNLIPDSLVFETLDRNQDLSTTLAGQTITENAGVPISSLAAPLFYPYIFQFKTKVPLNFMTLLSGAANGHIKFRYNGIELYGFPLEVSQKPALSEDQEWKLLCSPATDPGNLVDLNIDGLNFIDMAGHSTFIPHTCPVHFVPLGYVNPSQYHHLTMEQDWFKNRIKSWIAQNDYFNPWQTNDVIKIQCQTNGLGPVQVEVMDCDGNVITTIPLSVVITNAVKQPNVCYQGLVPLTGLSEAIYYLVLTAGTGSAITKFVSEGLWVKADWPETLLIEYSNKVNKQATIFTNGYKPSLRVHGRIVRYEPGSRFAVHENQPADIEMLDGIPYDTFKLEIGFNDGGIPDYKIRKLSRIMLLTDTSIDGWYYTRNGDAKWERTNFPGQPKEYWSLDIRYTDNRDGITLSTDGTVDQNISIVYNIQANAFGENSGVSNVLQVEQQNV